MIIYRVALVFLVIGAVSGKMKMVICLSCRTVIGLVYSPINFHRPGGVSSPEREILDKGLGNVCLDADHAALVIKYVFGSDFLENSSFSQISSCTTFLFLYQPQLL